VVAQSGVRELIEPADVAGGGCPGVGGCPDGTGPWATVRPVRIAALDLGSNSFHLLVADVRADGGIEPVVRDKEMLRLGSQVAATGSVGEASTRAAVEVVARFAALANSLGADLVVACATAALREARDARRVIGRIEDRTGIAVRVISGVEEARLIFGAVRASVVIDPPALALDLGGGSLELMIGGPAGLDWSASVGLGVGRLTAELVRGDPPSPGDRRRLVRRVETELAPHRESIRRLAPLGAIGSSGTIGALIRLTAARRGLMPTSINQLTVELEELRSLEADLLGHDSASRLTMPGVDARRADLLPAGIVTLITVMELAGVSEIMGSDWALREGMVLEAAGAPADSHGDVRHRSVLELCRRSRWSEVHSRKVSRLSLELFDGTAERHGLGLEDRDLLELGGLLHDIGDHVSTENHEQHSAYLIRHGRLRGFSPEELDVLSCLGRFHRRGGPKASFEPWLALSPERRERTTILIALLQAADALDRGHGGPVRDVTVRAGDGPVIEVEVDADGDIALERYTLRKKGELLERVFGCRIELVQLDDPGGAADEVGGRLVS
jgi:exopolyphosphatase/guanosine-5'-triphosphate,3'-diphosphate pyrophosphatase